MSWRFWCFSPFGAPMAPFLGCTNGSFGWTNGSFGWTNGSLVEVNQWLLCLGEPMAPLLGWTNGSLLGVHQWFPSWGAPMAPLLGWTNGSLVGEDQNHFPPAGGLPQALFFVFAQNSFSKGKTSFPSAGGLPQAFFFFAQKWRFRWKNGVFAFYKGCQQSYREPFINFLFLLGHSQRKIWFYHFKKKLKIHFSRKFCFPLTGFFASKFSWFLEKKTFKK